MLPLTPPAVLTAVLAFHPASASAPTADAPLPAPTAETAPAPPSTPLPLTSPCPAYLGPQCDSVEHEGWTQAQDLAAMVLGR
ncbi:hypothetical protein [Pseudonocardia acidicola]|uniref:Uncharacterized protein n=1 Tax=Pseudonocardia acidicola TaxID=2724939 RepID=A0ABX1SH74_9PSEU|nr:hypothetical protein [Pseudonocardia acidicola]NMI00917.1 hypothetical protein [Pseudonocardia acidicola]